MGFVNVQAPNQRLHDTYKDGKKERPWSTKKKASVEYGNYLSAMPEYNGSVQVLTKNKSRNVSQCGDYLKFAKTDHGLKLYQTYFCKSRLCPLCSWRRSMKQSMEMAALLKQVIELNPNVKFLFLTLTEKNSSGNDLARNLKLMTTSSNRLFKYKKVAKNLLGYARSTEITVNDDDPECITFHAHMHVLLVVKSTYFKDTSNYIPQAEWTHLWKKARKLDYEPVVNVELVKANARKGKSSLLASSQEVAKYQVKSKDILTGDHSRDMFVIDTLEKALYRTRQISFSGVLKDMRHDLKMDVDEDDLINFDVNDTKNVVIEYILAKWNSFKKDYYVIDHGTQTREEIINDYKQTVRSLHPVHR